MYDQHDSKAGAVAPFMATSNAWSHLFHYS